MIVLIGAVSVVGYGQLVVLKNARDHFAGIEELYAYKPLLEALRKSVVDANAKAETDKTTQGDDDAKKYRLDRRVRASGNNGEQRILAMHLHWRD